MTKIIKSQSKSNINSNFKSQSVNEYLKSNNNEYQVNNSALNIISK